MSFVSELRAELVEAAEREQARTLPRITLPLRPVLLTAAAAAALIAVIVIAAGSLSTAPDGDTQPAAEPTPDAQPLFGGELRPGVRYATRAFVPTLSFVVDDDKWRAIVTDRPDLLIMERGEGVFDPDGERRPPAGLGIRYMREVYDPAVRGLQASSTAAPADLYGWLREHPDLRVGRAEPVTVAGVPGIRFPVEVRFDKPAHRDPWCWERARVVCTAIAPTQSAQTGTFAEMTILRTEPDPLVIVIDHHTRAGLREIERATAPLLESLRIG